jgi:hypothetical protein
VGQANPKVFPSASVFGVLKSQYQVHRKASNVASKFIQPKEPPVSFHGPLTDQSMYTLKTQRVKGDFLPLECSALYNNRRKDFDQVILPIDCMIV